MQKDYFGIAFVASAFFHIVLLALMYFIALDAKPTKLPKEPIVLSLYEELPKIEQPKPQPQKIEKKKTTLKKSNPHNRYSLKP